MITKPFDILILGAGIFGVTAALELRRRHYRVALLDPGPLPHPQAASTALHKVIRMEYGADEFYMIMAEEALKEWHIWNETLATPLYHQTGVTMLTRQPMRPNDYEYESYQLLLKRNHTPERLTGDEIAARFPAWKPGIFVDGFYHALGGYVDSKKLMSTLLTNAQNEGVTIITGQTADFLLKEERASGTRITGVRTKEGQTFNTGQVIVAMGAWTPYFVDELKNVMKVSGHPIFHIKTNDPTLFTYPHFTVFSAEIAQSGWYGFPVHPEEGILKIVKHDAGQQLHPTLSPRQVTDSDIRQLRSFLTDTFPALIDATIVNTRRCLYCDTLDEHFWIDRHPHISGLTVAAGGSGHAFKFAPLLGGFVADALEGRFNPWLSRFRWRHLQADTPGQEASRHHNK